MERRQFYFIITLLLCVTAKSRAQWESPFSHYWEVKGYYNPSFAGEKDQISTAAVYRSQWAGITNAPQQIVVTAHMPFTLLNRKHATGIVAYKESSGTLRNTLLAAQYSFKQQFAGGMLNVGLQVGLYDLNYDTGGIKLITDTVQNTVSQNNTRRLNISNTDKQVADLNVGVSWTGKNFYAGLSLIHLNQPGFYINSEFTESDSTHSYIPRTYNFIAGYNIGLFSSLEIQPMILVLHDENQTEAHATMRLEYEKRFSGGFTLISEAGYSIFAGANIQGFRLGYAYTTYNKGIGSKSKGSHELYLKYDVPLDSFKPRLKPHKSIRLL